MNDLIFNLNKEQLKEIIKDSVREEVTELINKPEPKEKLLTADQAADFFSISRPTLWDWTRKKYLKSYHISGKTFYKENECMEALQAGLTKQKGGKGKKVKSTKS